MSVYSAYRVPQDTLPGLLTAYAKQYKSLPDTGHTDPRPRRQFITDLILEIKKKQTAGNHITLGINANEILQADGTKIKINIASLNQKENVDLQASLNTNTPM